MLDKKEVGTIFLVTLILALTISFLKMQTLLWVFIAVFIVLALNTVAKKLAAYYLESEIYIRPWKIEMSEFRKGDFFRTYIPIGIFLPIIVSIISLGRLFWMGSVVFDVKPKVSRAAKRHGLYSFSEMTEYHLGLIAAAGIFVTLLAAVIAYLIPVTGFSTFARLSIFYAFFNMLPLSDLDGNKIFFGNTVLWSFLATLVLIGIGYAFFLT